MLCLLLCTYFSPKVTCNSDRFLNYLMMGTAASPLYKALVDSGLGSRVIGGGLDDGMLQATFSVGLKDLKEEDVPKVEELVMKTLEVPRCWLGTCEKERGRNVDDILMFSIGRSILGGLMIWSLARREIIYYITIYNDTYIYIFIAKILYLLYIIVGFRCQRTGGNFV